MKRVISLAKSSLYIHSDFRRKLGIEDGSAKVVVRFNDDLEKLTVEKAE